MHSTKNHHNCLLCILLILLSVLIAGCGSPSSAEQPSAKPSNAERPLSTATTSVPSPGANLPTPATQVSSALTPSSEGIMTTGILYTEYEYFELEGVPPYVSHFVALERRDAEWVDLSDPRRYRHERHYRTRETAPHEGIEFYWIGTGAGGTHTTCDVYDGQTTCNQQPITDTLSSQQWLEQFTAMGHAMLAHKDDPQANSGFTYKGTQTDADWGEVYVFERDTPITAGEKYLQQPAVTRLLFDTQLLRRIEQRTTLTNDDTVYMLYRLQRWDMLDPATVPADLFDPERKPSESFAAGQP